MLIVAKTWQFELREYYIPDFSDWKDHVPLTTLRCYPCRKFPLKSCKSLHSKELLLDP